MKPTRYKPPHTIPSLNELTLIEYEDMEIYESEDAYYWRSTVPNNVYKSPDSSPMPRLNELVYADSRLDNEPIKGDHFQAGPTLSNKAQEDLDLQIDTAAIPWVKRSGESELLYLPKILKRFIRPIDEIVSFYRSTLPCQDLWEHIRVRGSITARAVRKKNQQRGVGVWHIEDQRKILDDVPNFTQAWIGVSNILPTVVASHVSKEQPADLENWEEYNRRYVKGIQRAQPYQMNIMSGYTWHMGDFATEDIYRNYLHLIFDIERHVLRKIINEFEPILKSS